MAVDLPLFGRIAIQMVDGSTAVFCLYRGSSCGMDLVALTGDKEEVADIQMLHMNTCCKTMERGNREEEEENK